jgi:hypothetical protein
VTNQFPVSATSAVLERPWWLFLYARKLCRLTLLLTPSLGLAADPVTTSDFPAPSQYFGLARVAAQPGKPVRFTQLLEYHCAEASCPDSDLFVANGDRLIMGAVEGNRIHVWFRGGGKYLRGWLPAANVRRLPFTRHPASDKWDGTWTVGDVRKIIIKADAASSTLSVTAHAEWHGGINGEVTHTGDVQGRAVPDGNRLVIRSGGLPDGCVLELELVDEFLGAEDNMQCGGMNVGFSDVYTRDARARSALK